MSILFWRYKDYSDDGCSIYECLNCYRSWEARTNPKYSEWKFCPYCGCTWEGEKEWDSSTKYKHKKGIPLERDMRLCLPLFIAEKRYIPFNNSEQPTEWEAISGGSENYLEVISTLEYHSSQEIDVEPFWSTTEYRIRFNPYKNKYSCYKGCVSKELSWRDVKISKYAIEKMKQYKSNIELIKKNAQKSNRAS